MAGRARGASGAGNRGSFIARPRAEPDFTLAEGGGEETYETVEVDEGHELGSGRAVVESSLMPGVGIGAGRRGTTTVRRR